MADKSLDQKTRKIDQTRVQKGNELETMQKAQNQFLAIQAERKQNLAQQRTIMGMDQQQNAMMMQGAQIIAANGRDKGVPQTVDPRTQAVMNKYGMGRPKFQHNTQRSQQVTKQNVTIHNTTNNNTTNNVNAGGYGGPVQGRALAFRGGGNESTEKFKVWLNNSYARQQQQAQIRNREYEKREDSLIRSENKMMRKLEGIGKTMSKVLDPRRVGQTLVDPLKMLFMFMGFHMFIKNWKILMNIMRKGERFFEGVAHKFGFSLENGHIGFNKSTFVSEADKKFGIIGVQLIKAFGGNPYRGDTIGQILHNIIIGDKQHYGLWEQIKTYLKDKYEERGEAIRHFPVPDLTKHMDGDKPNFVGMLSEFLGYLGNIASIMFSGSDAIKRINVKNQIKADKESYSSTGDEGYSKISISQDPTKQRKLQLELEKKIDHKKLGKSDINYYEKFNKGEAITVEDFLGKNKLDYLTNLGLNINPKSQISFDTKEHYQINSEEPDTYDVANLRFKDKNTGQAVTLNFGVNGELMNFGYGDLGIHVEDHTRIYRGDSLNLSDFSDNNLSSFNINEENRLISNVAVYKQFNELSKEIIGTNAGTKSFDATKFTIGIDRLKNFADDADKDGYMMIPEKALKTVLGLTDTEISNYETSEDIKKSVFLNIRRKATVDEVCRINGKTSPALAGFLEWINTNVYTFGQLGEMTAIKDYAFSSTTSVIGASLARRTQGRLTEKAKQKAAKYCAERGISKTTIIAAAEKRAAKRVALKFVGKGIARFIPGFGWALLAYDLFDLIYTYGFKRNAAVSSLAKYKNLEDEFKKCPKYIGDLIDIEEYFSMIDDDFSRDEQRLPRVFDVELLSQYDGKETGNINDAAVERCTIKVELLKKILKDKYKITDITPDLFNTIENDVYSEGNPEDQAHLTVNYAYQNLIDKEHGGSETFNARQQSVDPVESFKIGKTDLYKLEKKNRLKREARENEEIQSKITRTKAVEYDEKLTNTYGLSGLLRAGAGYNEKIKYLKEQLHHVGITNKDTQDAIIGNLLSESELDPAAKNEKGAEGIAQWLDKNRKKDVLNYINDKRKKAGLEELSSISEAGFEAQVSALLYNKRDGLVGSTWGKSRVEMMNAVDKNNNPLSLEDKTTLFMDKWEIADYSTAAHKNANDGKGSEKRVKEIARRLGKAKLSKGIEGWVPGAAASFLGDAVEFGVDGANKAKDTITNSSTYKNAKDTFSEYWNKVTDKAADKAGEISDALREKFETKTYRYNLGENAIGPEFKDYYYYTEHNGSLPPNMSRMKWEEAVHSRTGFYPSSLSDIATSFSKVDADDVTALNKERGYTDKELNIIADMAGWGNEKNRLAQEQAKKEKEEEKTQKKNLYANVDRIAVAVNRANGIAVAAADHVAKTLESHA